MSDEVSNDPPSERGVKRPKAFSAARSDLVLGAGGVRAVIFDYGCVLSLPLDDGSVARMGELLGIAPERFMEVYLRPRRRYDLGEIGLRAYWSEVMAPFGGPPDEGMLTRLFLEDVGGWMRLRAPMVEWARAVKERGFKVAILSNMPPDHIDYIGAHSPWFALFDVKVFSAAVQLAKPDPAIYRRCVAELALPPGECLFIDDLLPNVEAARREGLSAIRFESEEALAAELAGFRELPAFPSDYPR